MRTATTMTTNLRRRTLLATAIMALGCAGASSAIAASANLVDLAVVNRETGEPLRIWRHNGRAYVAGQPGARYGLRVTNNSGERVLVVMSVDGVNVLTGQTAAHNQRGYVFERYQSYDVSGWRKSDTQVAAFNFASLSRSYAARTGRPGDVGVIGIAAFAERRVEPVMEERRPYARDDSLDEVVVGGAPFQQSARGAARAAPSPVAPASSGARADASRARVEEKLGTGHGAREHSVVTSVAFERATTYPQQVRQIEYDTYDNLAALGVIRRAPDPSRRPRPFPASGYVPDPPGMP